VKRELVVTYALVQLGCVDAPSGPAQSSQEPAAVLHPGYCVAYSHLGSAMAGATGERRAIYDDDDLLVADVFDSDLDGDVDRSGTYEYDDRDRLVRYAIDDFDDGVPDEIRTYVWDADDRMTHERWDLGADDTIDMDIVFEHDDGGLRLRGIGQADDDPEPELVMSFAYEDGQLVTLQFDGLRGPPDNAVDRVAFYAYDDAGNVAFAFFDLDADGTSDLTVEYTYDCW
jgi:hypothetical protein